MKPILLIICIILFKSSCFSQTFDIHVASLSGKYFYKGMDSFVVSYNDFYKDDLGGLAKPMEFKSVATGWQVGSTLGFEIINFSVDIASVKTSVSRAEWSLGYNRGIQLKSFLFDLDCGFFVIPSEYKLRLSVGLGVTLQSTQIESFFEFDKVRSYGSESSFNGVWTSWKGYTPLVLKLYYLSSNERWKIYSILKFPIQNKKVVSFGYNYSSGFGTSAAVFPSAINSTTSLNENFRFVNLAIGIAYNITND